MIENNKEYLVQVGKNKSKYTTRYSFTDMQQAIFYYRCINIGNGYKKRLVANNKVMARAYS